MNKKRSNDIDIHHDHPGMTRILVSNQKYTFRSMNDYFQNRFGFPIDVRRITRLLTALSEEN